MQNPDGSVVDISPNSTLRSGPISSMGQNTGVAGGMQPGGDQSLAGMSPEQQYWAAVKGLGWDTSQGNRYRGQQQPLVDYLSQHGAGQWQGGGAKADDWLQDPSGGQHDIITSGGQLVFNPDDPGQGGGQGVGMGGGGSLIDDPGYQFQLGEGLKALQRSAAAKGTLLTGGTLKGLQGYAQNFANNAYQNAFGRNYALANMGLNAAQDLNQAGQNFGGQAGNLLTQQGNAQAAGTVGKTNPWIDAMGSIGRGMGQSWSGGTF